jgi:phosphoadenosine phosphosulfate reductase
MRAVEKLLASKRLLVHIARDFKPVAMFQSFSPQDMVLADLIYSDLVHQEYAHIEMFTVDTGRLPEALLRCIEHIRQRYGDVLKIYYPNALELEYFDASYSVRHVDRMKGNEVRLFKPLGRALSDKKAWITANSVANETRRTDDRISWDSAHQIPRFNPLARWTADEISTYAKRHDLPVPGYALETRQDKLSRGIGWVHFPETSGVNVQKSWESTPNIA